MSLVNRKGSLAVYLLQEDLTSWDRKMSGATVI